MNESARLTCFHYWHELSIGLLLGIVLIAAGVLMPGFLRWDSQLFLSRQSWELALLALGMTPIIISGGIDLSVGAMMGLCAVMFGQCYSQTGDVPVSCLACLATGAACGMLNGLLITWAKVHPLIVTLATLAAFRGMAEGISQGASYSRFGEPFAGLARGAWLGIPGAGLLVLLLAIGFGILLATTSTGRFVYAIGHNELAARFAGVPVERLKWQLYLVSGVLASLATLIYISKFDSAKADAGKGIELEVITAVVVGGTSIFGGRGNMVGTCLGLLLIHETRLFVSRYWRTDELRAVVIGFLLIVSVLVYQALAGKRRL